MADSRSDFSIDTVPTSTGCRFSCNSAMLSATALYFSFSVRNTTSGFSSLQQRLVGGNDHDLEFVDLLELGRFGLGCAGHAAQLLVEPEVILEGDRRQRLVFFADADAFLGLDRLVQIRRSSAAPASGGR